MKTELTPMQIRARLEKLNRESAAKAEAQAKIFWRYCMAQALSDIAQGRKS